MEEIGIIELFKRIKEGRAPKEIMINGDKYDYYKDWMTLDETYFTKAHGGEENICYWEMDFMTKIKILDKPIIEEIPLIEIKHDYSNGSTNDTYEVERAITNGELADKINEIIRYLNKEEK